MHFLVSGCYEIQVEMLLLNTSFMSVFESTKIFRLDVHTNVLIISLISISMLILDIIRL